MSRVIGAVLLVIFGVALGAFTVTMQHQGNATSPQLLGTVKKLSESVDQHQKVLEGHQRLLNNLVQLYGQDTKAR